MDNGAIKARKFGGGANDKYVSPGARSHESASHSNTKKIKKYNEDINGIMKDKINTLKSKKGSLKGEDSKNLLNLALKRASTDAKMRE
jgi:hypothetical protein